MKEIVCDCGYVVRGSTDDSLVGDATVHARTVHGIELTREQILAMAKPADPVDLASGPPSTTKEKT